MFVLTITWTGLASCVPDRHPKGLQRKRFPRRGLPAGSRGDPFSGTGARNQYDMPRARGVLVCRRALWWEHTEPVPKPKGPDSSTKRGDVYGLLRVDDLTRNLIISRP